MDRRLPAGFWFASGVVGLAVVGAFITLSAVIGEDFAVPAMIAGVVGTIITLRGPVGKALARYIEGAAAAGPSQLQEENAAELDDMRARLVELEERVDFAERLLASGREAAAPVARRED